MKPIKNKTNKIAEEYLDKLVKAGLIGTWAWGIEISDIEPSLYYLYFNETEDLSIIMKLEDSPYCVTLVPVESDGFPAFKNKALNASYCDIRDMGKAVKEFRKLARL